MSQAVPNVVAEPAAKTRLRLWLKLLKLSREIEGELRDNFRVEFESTLPRFDVMAALHRFPEGLRMNELSAVLKVSNGNVTGIVDRLVNDSLIVRVAEPCDRRAMRVKLTPAGKKEFLKQAIQHEGWVDTLLGNVSVDDAENMMEIADKAFSRNPEEHPDQ
ncbi:MAG: MarR family winged helix-turn-helix transcriptional regulator [Granulosicoccus sp.]